MDKREFIKMGLIGISGLGPPARAQIDDKWGASRGYPIGVTDSIQKYPELRVGNYSGGFEQAFPFRKIAPATIPTPFEYTPVIDLRYRQGFFTKSPDDYLKSSPVTGLLVCRDNRILFERYRFGRTETMRLTSFSMAKSVTSLLLGICLDKGLISSYDDEAQKYLPELQNSLHGSVTLRNLSNMSSGAAVDHQRDSGIMNLKGLLRWDSRITPIVQNWNKRAEDQGRRFNYNELCALTIGMVIRRVTNQSLSEFSQDALWGPLGAQDMATWTTDSIGDEYNCIGFAATLRDWGRLGVLVAGQGRVRETQVLSESWVNEFTSWGPLDAQVRYGMVRPTAGYKAFMWHLKPDGSRLYFGGHHGQRVVIDMPTRTVLVQTAVDDEGNWQPEMLTMLDAFTKA